MTQSLFKKTVLAASIVGLTLGVYADDENKSTTASTGSTILASAGTVVGTGCLVAGAIKTAGILFQPDICKIFPPSVSNLIINDPHYALLMIPGVLLIAGSTMYLARSAKTRFAKIRSFWGSIATTAGGIALAIGCAGVVALRAKRKTLQSIHGLRNILLKIRSYEELNNNQDNINFIRLAIVHRSSADRDYGWYMDNKIKLDLPEDIQVLSEIIDVLSIIAAAGGLVATVGTVLQP